MDKRLNPPPTPADHINTGLSPGIGEIIEVAMAKNRDERYLSTGDMLEDLRLVRKGEPPTHARRQVDLETFAKIEETARTVDIDPAPVMTSDLWSRPLVQWIGTIAAISLLINLILVVVMILRK